MDLQFRQRQRRFYTKVPFFPLSVGNKIYRPLSFCSAWGEIPHETGATCLPWVASRMLEKRILVVERSPGISSFSTHCFGLCFRREFRVRPDPFQSARSCFALEMHYFALHFLLSLRIFYGTYRVRITLFFLALCAFRWAAADGLINGVHFSALAIAERVGR